VGIVEPKQVEIYRTAGGDIPYETWLDGLKDGGTRARIEVQIAKIRLGNLGRWKSLGEGVGEIVLDFGPGYRIYFAQLGTLVVLLLLGGDKRTQRKDITAAKRYWADYQTRSNKEKSHDKTK
jgi:putative addiction module killer protein